MGMRTALKIMLEELSKIFCSVCQLNNVNIIYLKKTVPTMLFIINQMTAICILKKTHDQCSGTTPKTKALDYS